jgi:CheY-like chemotaxis protein
MADRQKIKVSTRVLIVEDDTDAAELLGLGLARADFDVAVVPDGESALEHVKREIPDVVVLDLGLPGMDGVEVARRLRQRPELCSRWILALTGYGDDVQRRRSLQAGIDMHLEKPVEAPALVELLRALVTDGERTLLPVGSFGETLSVFERRKHQPAAAAPTEAPAKLLELARSFPSLRNCPLDRWDAAAFDEWASGRCSSEAARHAARFVLSLWNDQWPWKIGAFDVQEAVRHWDPTHRSVVVHWTLAPWWA